MSDENLLGVTTATAVAGFAGAVVSLSVNKPLTRFQAIIAVLTGLLTSAYVTPAVAYYYQIDAEPLKNGMAFVIGLTSLYMATGIIFIAKTVSQNPFKFFRKFDGEEK